MLLFGGMECCTGYDVKNCYIIRIKKNAIYFEKACSLMDGAKFMRASPIWDQEGIKAIDDKGRIHIYKCIENKWVMKNIEDINY